MYAPRLVQFETYAKFTHSAGRKERVQYDFSISCRFGMAVYIEEQTSNW